MSKIVKLALLILLGQGFCLSEVFAVTKLSESMTIAKKKLIAANDYMNENMEQINATVSQALRYKSMVQNGEWMALANSALGEGFVQGQLGSLGVDMNQINNYAAMGGQAVSAYQNGGIVGAAGSVLGQGVVQGEIGKLGVDMNQVGNYAAMGRDAVNAYQNGGIAGAATSVLGQGVVQGQIGKLGVDVNQVNNYAAIGSQAVGAYQNGGIAGAATSVLGQGVVQGQIGKLGVDMNQVGNYAAMGRDALNIYNNRDIVGGLAFALQQKQNIQAAIKAKKDDCVNALKDAQQEKNKQIQERLTELQAKIQSQNITDEERNTISTEIASLEAQKQQNLDKPLENDETCKGYEEEEKKADEEVKALAQETEEKTLAESLKEKSNALFADEAKDENLKSIYQTEIEALFLKENEESTSENLARIKKNRNREYYRAIQKAMDVSVAASAASPEINEKLKQYMEMAGQVEGNFSLKNANISVVIESAKAAALLTEALLAEVRLKTTQDMASWNNKNRLYDYEKPVTEFDLDSYELKKDDLKTNVKNLFKFDKGKINELYNYGTDQLKSTWHKI